MTFPMNTLARFDDYSPAILVVDDEPNNLKLLSEYLHSHGFHVTIASNSARALERVRHEKPDLILLDVLMPEMDGFETCRQLKRDDDNKDIPVIFLTALTNPEDKIRGFEAGAVDFVTKPIQLEELLARVRTHLTLRLMQKKLLEQNNQLKMEIAERKQAEAALRESEARYRSLFEDSPISLWEEDFSLVKAYFDDLRASGITDFRTYFESHPEAVADCAGLVKVLDVNQATLTLLESRDKEILLAGLSKIFVDKEMKVFREELITMAEGGQKFESDEEIHRTLTGKEKFVTIHTSVAPGYEHSLGKVLVSLIDVTERKRVEEALRKSEARYHSIIEDQTELICRYLPDGRLSFVNQAYARYYDETAQRLINTNFIPQIPEPDMSTVVNKISEITPQEPSVVYEHRIIKPDGEIRWQRWTHWGIYDARGNLIEHQAVGNDITERKQAEEKLHRYLSELKVLYDNGLAISALLEPREIGRKIIKTLSRNLSWHHIAIRLRRGETEDLELIAFNQPGLGELETAEAEKRLNALVSKVGQGLSGWSVQIGQAIRTGNVREHPQYVDSYSGTRSGVYMPLAVGERVIGCIAVESEAEDAFTEQDERLLATLAAQTAIAFENARLYQDIQQELQERERAEAALANEKEFTETALDSQRDTFFVFEVSDRAIRWNRIFRDTTGYSNEEIASLKAPDSYFSPEDLEKITSFTKTIMLDRNGRIELSLVCKDGRKIPTEYEVSFIQDKTGQTNYIIAIGRDITERKQAEEQIQLLAKFPAEDPNPVLRVAGDGTLRYINEAGLRLLPQWDLQIGEAVHPILREAVSQSMQNGTTQTLDLEHGKRLFAFYVAPILSAGYANLYGHDITESGQVKALQDAEARYRVLFEQSPHGVLLADFYSGEIIEANEVAGQQLGYSREEFANLKISDYEASENAEQIAQHMQKIVSEGRDDFETLHRTKSGEIRNVHVWAKTLQLTDRILFYAILQDITERKQAEEDVKNAHKQLERSLRFNEALLSAIPTPVFYKDKEGRYLGCNSAFAEFTGVSSVQLMGKTVMELWPSEDAEVYHEKDLELMRKSERQIYEFRVRGKDGIDHPVIFAKDVFLDENKQVAGIVGAFLDITARKQMEEANEAYNREIALLEERQRISNDLHDAVSQTLFSARLAAEMLLRQPDRQADAFTRSLVDLHRLVRSASGEIRLILVELRNNALLTVSLDTLLANLIDSGMARTNANLIFQCQVENLVLPAKIKLAFYRIAQEATSNAIKHGKPDNIQCTLRDNEQTLEMLIRDDGTGFSDDLVLDDHFGLQIMRERAEQAGLKLTIASQPGQGTSVAVCWEKEQG